MHVREIKAQLGAAPVELRIEGGDRRLHASRALLKGETVMTRTAPLRSVLSAFRKRVCALCLTEHRGRLPVQCAGRCGAAFYCGGRCRALHCSAHSVACDVLARLRSLKGSPAVISSLPLLLELWLRRHFPNAHARRRTTGGGGGGWSQAVSPAEVRPDLEGMQHRCAEAEASTAEVQADLEGVAGRLQQLQRRCAEAEAAEGCQLEDVPLQSFSRLVHHALPVEYRDGYTKPLRRLVEAAAAVYPTLPPPHEQEMLVWLARVEANGFGIELRNGRCAGRLIVPDLSYFNHSCAPNAELHRVGSDTLAIRTTAAVPAGAELNIPYVEPSMAGAARRAALWDVYGFECRCSRCVA